MGTASTPDVLQHCHVRRVPSLSCRAAQRFRFDDTIVDIRSLNVILYTTQPGDVVACGSNREAMGEKRKKVPAGSLRHRPTPVHHHGGSCSCMHRRRRRRHVGSRLHPPFLRRWEGRRDASAEKLVSRTWRGGTRDCRREGVVAMPILVTADDEVVSVSSRKM